MNKSEMSGSTRGLSQRLFDLELPITVQKGFGPSEHPELKSNLLTFGAVANFLSTPFVDAELTAAEYSQLDVEAKQERDMIAGRWSPGRQRSCDKRTKNFMQSYFVLDVAGWQRDEFEELIRISVIPVSIAVVIHSLRGHTADSPKVRMIFPLFEPILLADAYLAQPGLPELLCHLDLSGRVVGDCLSEVDCQLELPSVSRDKEYLFYAVDGAPIFADSILDMLNDDCLYL